MTAVISIAAIHCGPASEPPPPAESPVTKVGFVYLAARGTSAWTAAHEFGRAYLESFAANVTTSVIEDVTRDTAEGAIEQLYVDGNKIIFATSFDTLAAAQRVAERHDDITVLNCSGFKTGKNFGTYMARIEESEYLTGMVAGALTTSNKIGLVAPLKIYEHMVYVNAFALGVREVNPNAQVLVRWIGGFVDPTMGIPAVDELLAAGADVIKPKTRGRESTMHVSAAGKLAMGHSTPDWCDGIERCVTTAYYNWGPMYATLVDDIRSNRYPRTGRIDYRGLQDLESNGVAPMSPEVPDSVKENVEQRRRDMIEHRFELFKGPFNYDDGTLWVDSGRKLPDSELFCMDRYVEGVVELPGPMCDAQTMCPTGFSCAAAEGRCRANYIPNCN